MFTLLNPAKKKNDARWHSVTSLREHSDVAREYATLKNQLAAVTDATDERAREAYANAKSEFIERMSEIALRAGYPRGLDRS
jgi:GrpB-like predicted nucleotidyltransferase (UPF0157 family)